MGKLDLAYEHFLRAARADLGDIRGNASDGIHIASAGGLWQAVAFGFAGLRITESGPTFNPKLPSHWQRLAFNIVYRGERVRFEFKK
jgi:kojibiose phosphorylase